MITGYNSVVVTSDQWLEAQLEARILAEPMECPECGSHSIGTVDDDEMGLLDGQSWECDECAYTWLRGDA